MRAAKRKKLEAAGWTIGDTADFLQLSPDESTYIEMKLALGGSLRERRQARGISQTELASLVKSSQSRVAKMEAGDPSVSIDLIVRSLLVLGARPKDVAKAVSSIETTPA